MEHSEFERFTYVRFAGKQIVQLQASLALVQNSTATSSSSSRDAHDREPFSHPALNGLQNLSPRTKNALTDRKSWQSWREPMRLRRLSAGTLG